MKVVHEYPPNYEQVLKVFPSAKQRGVIFTYGDTVYAPNITVNIPMPLMVHEKVHSDRQTNPAEWWDKYLTDTDFRFEEELVAHIAEYKTYVSASRNRRRLALKGIAERISSDLYGNMVSEKTATQLLKRGYNGQL